ncbi:MAG: NTP transferase domain-containing protein [Gammaproteobacteria bacterium]|nr:NTP transferase domain-containing protein [Gammaproteobacteria bacterium]MDH4313847.1 NTP transferase domain-containing protein [Gammaproteobacteria bacterium]MDH5213675.1 NTP transferase domain-containing protein [Gammaproteobacteria bacterium]MDH5500891.1 NTP transferase domain-containing protein [Gammaproteobacteria bacterium]
MKAASKPKGLVLSGGQSRRMGRDKALLKQDGMSQLRRAVKLLREHLDEVFVSVRAEQSGETERARFPQIVDRYSGLGPVAGILSAMDFDESAAWLVVACDLPKLDANTIHYLLQHRATSQPFTAYKSSVDGLPEPLCTIYEASSRGIIDNFVTQGMHCPRKMLICSDTLLLDQPNPQALDNVNTPDDLLRTTAGLAS